MTVANDFIARLIAQRRSVTVFLLNGVKLQGLILEADSASLLLQRDNLSQLVFLNAVSTIMPISPPNP